VTIYFVPGEGEKYCDKLVSSCLYHVCVVVWGHAKDIRRRGRDSGNALEAGALTAARAKGVLNWQKLFHYKHATVEP